MSLDAAALECSLGNSSLDLLQHPHYGTPWHSYNYSTLLHLSHSPTQTRNVNPFLLRCVCQVLVEPPDTPDCSTDTSNPLSTVFWDAVSFLLPFDHRETPFPFVLKITIIPRFSVHISYSALEKADGSLQLWMWSVHFGAQGLCRIVLPFPQGSPLLQWKRALPCSGRVEFSWQNGLEKSQQ